jgi:hypothetical protein
MNVSVKILTAAALALGGAVALLPEPASAQGYRVFRGGFPGAGPRAFAGPGFGYRPAFGAGPAFRAGYVGPRYGFGGGYRPAYYGPRYGFGGGYRPYGYYGWRGGYRPAYYGGYYPYGYYRRGYSGSAVAAGLIGGLALGSIVSAAANPYYYGGYYAPAYYAPSNCVVERRRFVNRWGRVVTRRIETCY